MFKHQDSEMFGLKLNKIVNYINDESGQLILGEISYFAIFRLHTASSRKISLKIPAQFTVKIMFYLIHTNIETIYSLLQH